MCRIAGIINGSLNDASVYETVKRMCDALQHGGPDDAGIYSSANNRVLLGHRRLSIIDLSEKGHQPMADTQQKAWITFNGEIYNYLQLKNELLKLGANFNTNTDTEVIIQAYLYWGTHSFAKLRGMFAFALYDTQTGRVYLVRDTNGIKPLYYSAEHNRLTFASEIKAFKQKGAGYIADERWPVWLLAYGNIPEPYTTLKNVLSLPKGSYLCWEQNNTYTINKYTIASNINYITDIETAKAGIRQHLDKAIQRQLMADAPIGVFLSGGIDSSLLALIANQHIEQLKTVSIFFNEKAFDERVYQNAVFNKINGDSFTHLVTQHDFDTYLPDIIKAIDMPTTDGINSWFISKYAREAGLKTVLSGLGADELFGGYPSFKRIKYLRYLKKLPSALFSAARFSGYSQYKRFEYLAYNNPTADYLFLRALYTSSDIAEQLEMDVSQVNQILFDTVTNPYPDTYDQLHAAWLETNLYMQNQLLHDTDAMSMWHGLEVRVPFLDEDFQQYVQQMHPSVRFDSQKPKKILVESYKNLLPQEVWDRPKMGFTFPLQQWMRSNKVMIDECLYRGKAAKNTLNKFRNGQVHWSKIFALYQVQNYV